MHKHAHRTGDVNLAATLMALGIPPDPHEPAEVIQNCDGRDYHSFNLAEKSICGTYSAYDLSEAWSNPVKFWRDNPEHPFCLLMDFIRATRGARTVIEYLEIAADYFGLTVDAIKQVYADLNKLTATSPEMPITYVCCFIANRFAAIQWLKRAVPKEVYSHRGSMAILDGKLSKDKKNYILSNLK